MYFSSLLGIFDNFFTIISPKISSSLRTTFVSLVATRFFKLNVSAVFSILLATHEISKFDFDTYTLLSDGHSSEDFRLIFDSVAFGVKLSFRKRRCR